MEISKYRLKSSPELSINIPNEYAKRAEYVLGVVFGNSEQTNSVDSGDFGNDVIINKYLVLAKSNTELKKRLLLQDEVYVRVCLSCNKKRLNGVEAEEASGLDIVLEKLFSDLEQERIFA